MTRARSRRASGSGPTGAGPTGETGVRPTGAAGVARAARAARAAGVARAAATAAGMALVSTAVLVRPRRVVVQGRSMEPTLAPGDRLLVVRARRLHSGDVVAVRDPRDRRRVLVKRISAVLDDEIVLRGDNPSASTDSRSFGPVPPSAVLGRVIRCYSPAWRAGPVS